MFKTHLKRTIFFGVLGLLAGLGLALITPRVYESRTQLLLGEPNRGPSVLTDEAATIVSQGQSQGVPTGLSLLRGQDLFYEALRRTAESRGDRDLIQRFEALYQLYDVEGIIADNPNQQSSVVLIRARAYEPNDAADLANHVANVYNDRRKAAARSAVAAAEEYLKVQVEQTQAEIKRLDADYRKYKEDHGLEDLTAESQQGVVYRISLQQQRDNIERELEAVSAELAVQQGELTKMPKRDLDIEQSERRTASQLRQDLAGLMTQRAALLSRYYEDATQVKAVEESIAEVKRRIAEAEKDPYTTTIQGTRPFPNRADLEQRILVSKARKANLERQLGEAMADLVRQEERMKKLPSDEQRLIELVRERTVLEQLYARLKQQAEEVRHRASSSSSAAQVLFAGVPDTEPIAPNILSMVVLGLLGGLIVGVVFSFGMEAYQMKIHSSAQLSEVTGLPVLATVPRLAAGERRRMLRSLPQAGTRPAESFKYMAFSAIARFGAEGKVLLFTSVRGQAGSALAAGQFALAMARAGVKTVLMDADLGAPALTRSFGMEGKPGASDLLAAGSLGSGDPTVESSHENLRFLPAGTKSGVLLGDYPLPAIESLASALRGTAQLVILQTSPVDVYSDASALAKYVDEAVIVVSATRSSFRDLPPALEILRLAGAQNISFVLTDASTSEEAFAGVSSGSAIVPTEGRAA